MTVICKGYATQDLYLHTLVQDALAVVMSWKSTAFSQWHWQHQTTALDQALTRI